jgi:predicted HicB family RNase H-like nuclease
MGKFVIKTEVEKISSINRTIRIKPEVFDKLMEISEKSGVSFNKLVGQCLEYALSNLEEEPPSP